MDWGTKETHRERGASKVKGRFRILKGESVREKLYVCVCAFVRVLSQHTWTIASFSFICIYETCTKREERGKKFSLFVRAKREAFRHIVCVYVARSFQFIFGWSESEEGRLSRPSNTHTMCMCVLGSSTDLVVDGWCAGCLDIWTYTQLHAMPSPASENNIVHRRRHTSIRIRYINVQ